ncbi:sacsin N-terminal ATP-binding-like domain-containing protein [Chloroflexota bacterium]
MVEERIGPKTGLSTQDKKTKESPETTVMRMARERLSAFVATIRPDGTYVSRVYLSLKSITEEIQHDYARRFLVELIQNGYDAHETSERAGEVAIHLCVNEGEHGVLYVANKGVGFTRENVEALCDVGLSDKPIGQTVGNKGLGFRSVASISDDPQVFSKDPNNPSPQFNGFCFRFAGPSDFDTLLSDDVHKSLANQDLPRFHIPIHIQGVPGNTPLDSFAQAGFATVLCLPLRSTFALDAVMEAIDELHLSEVPILLFLPKLSRLTVEVEGGPGKREFVLSRVPQSLHEEDTTRKDTLEIVDLSEFGKFFVAWRRIPETRVRGAIERSVEQRQLHEIWSKWLGDGEVAVAVPIDGQEVVPRLYTYFPMGPSAVAPIRGFLHGSFYPKLDRTSMDSEVPLNELCLTEAVRLCATTIQDLRSSAWPLEDDKGETAVGGVIIDFMSWHQALGISGKMNVEFPALVLKSFEELGADLQSGDFLPRISSREKTVWASPAVVTRLDKFADLEMLGISSLVRVGGLPTLPPTLGLERVERLEVFLKQAGIRENLAPSDEQTASAVEAVARKLHTQKASVVKWTAFYRDLAEVINRTNGRPWFGRSILLCNDGQLRASPPPGTPDTSTPTKSVRARTRRRTAAGAIAVFFPPVQRQDGSEDESQALIVPHALRRWFAVLDERFDWSGELLRARIQMEAARLVRRHDSEELVTHISGVLTEFRSLAVRRAALEWVFRLWRAFGPNLLRRARLYVPTVEDRWIPSNHAIFSAGWPERTLGDTLHSLILRAGQHSEDLSRLRPSMIAGPESIPFSRGPIDQWTEFLELLGVQKGLRPLSLDASLVEMWGWEISLQSICARLKLGSRTYEYMRRAMDNVEPTIRYEGTRHSLRGAILYLPGQEEFAELDEDSRELYACLVIECLSEIQETSLRMELVSESRPVAGRTPWSSPMLSFLTEEQWLPMEVGEVNTESTFLRPREILLERDIGERLPSFLPRPSRRVRESLAHGTAKDALARVAGAGYYDDPNSLIVQVQILTAAFRSGVIPHSQLTTFENVYWETWRRIVGSKSAEDWEWMDSDRVVLVRSQGALVDLPLSDLEKEHSNGEALHHALFVRDDDSGLAASLLEDLGNFVIDVGGQRAKAAGDFFVKLVGGLCRRTSEVEIGIHIDGQRLTEHSALAPAVSLFPALPQVVSLCMASLVGPAAQRLPRDWGRVLDILQRIRLTSGTNVEISIEEKLVRLPQRFFGSIAIGDPTAPTVILESPEPEIGWPELQRASRSLARLLGHSDLEKALALAFSRLHQAGTSPTESGSGLPDEELYQVLQLDDTAVRRAASALGSSLDRAMAFFLPLVHYFVGSASTAEFAQSVANASTTVELAMLASQLIPEDALSEEKILSLLQSCRTLEDVMGQLGLDFGRFNSSLVELGNNPITYPDRHLYAVKSFVSEHHNEIMDRLRTPHLTTFQSFGDLGTYVAARSSLATLQPKPDWLTLVMEPDTEMLESLVSEWIESVVESPKVVGSSEMPQYTDIHEKNAKSATETIRNAVPLVKAWCRKSGIPPEHWNDSSVVQLFTNRLNDWGALDFLPLQPSDVLRWLGRLGIWPEGMPNSISMTDLGLTEEGLDWERQLEREAREVRERERRSIGLNGRLLDPQEMSGAALAEEYERLLDAEVLRTPVGTLRPILAPQSEGRSRSPRRDSTTPRSPRPRLNQEKTELVGFLGELAVYKWLKQRLPRRNIDDAWVSSNRSKLLPGAGNDSLGYDFEVYIQRRRVFLEVKAHLDDPQSFDLGETEVICAEDCHRRSGCEYHIVYVSNVANTPSLKIELLPNPLSDEGESAYRLDGQGLRYRFRRLSR